MMTKEKETVFRKALLFFCIGRLIFFFLDSNPDVKAQDAEFARKVIEDLTDPSMRGRGFVHNGSGRAARYVRKYFKESGAYPVNGRYRQTFRLDINTFPGPVMISVNGILLNPVRDYLPDPASPGIKGDFGIIKIDASDILSGTVTAKLGEATENDLLYIYFPGFDTLDPDLKKEIRNFLIHLQKETPTQAAGIVEMQDNKLNWSSSQHVLRKPWLYLHKDVAIDSLSRLNIHIKNRWLEEKKANNITGIIEGSRRPDSFIVFTAHYDHLGSLGKTIIFPGANDNASGTAMLLSLMKYYACHSPAYTVVFLSLAAEECGLTGSSYFVRNAPIDLRKIRFLVNFDLVGTGEEGITVVNASEHSKEFHVLEEISRADSLIPVIKARGEACISDHCPFHKCGVPCFYLYTMGGSKEYHNPYDTAESLSLAVFENCKKLVIQFADKLQTGGIAE